MLGKSEGKRRRGQQRMSWLNGIIDSMGVSLGCGETAQREGQLFDCAGGGHPDLKGPLSFFLPTPLSNMEFSPLKQPYCIL